MCDQRLGTTAGEWVARGVALGPSRSEQAAACFADALVADLNALFQLEPIQFDSGSATIRPESTATLDRAAELLLANEDATVRIDGHTDDQGDAGFNQTLSEQRAEAVLQFLVGQGVAAERLTSQGFGEDDPIGDNATDEGRQQNRRIEFTLT